MEGLRSSKRRLAAALTSSLALAAGSWPSPGAAQPAARPEGLIALYQYGQCAKRGECGLVRPKAADNPAIAGLMIRLKWKDVQTGPRVADFNWEMTDNVFRQASANKFVVLSFVPGIETPDWALDRIPEGGKEKFCIPYGLKTEVGTEIMLPLPWNQTYLKLWYDFLQAVSERYARNPRFLMIAAAGPTSVSEEMSLPGAQISSKVCSTEAALKTWMSVGYTPEKYLGAWREVFKSYATLFPNQYVSLALYRGLPIALRNRAPVAEVRETPQRIIASGMTELAGKFAVEANGLVANSPRNMAYQLVRSSGGRAVTGFELATAATKRPEVEGDAESPARALCLALRAGLAAGVNFIEIYQEDAASDDPAVRNVLQAFARQLLSRAEGEGVACR